MTARLMMIGLDAADAGLVQRFMGEGVMPRLAALRDRGVMRPLAAPPGSTDDSLWASFQYGLRLGEHGRYHWGLPLPGGEIVMAYELEALLDPFWIDLDGRRPRSAVLDIPKCAPPRPLNGIHLADWLTHGRYFDSPRSEPAELAAEIVARFGPAPPSTCGYFQEPLSDPAVATVVSNLRASVSRKRAMGLHYLGSEAWDLFLIGFKEAHCGGHALWNFIDERHAEYDAARNLRLGEPLKCIFADLDAAVGDLVTTAGPDTQVAILSTSEMEPNRSLAHLMPELVDRINRHLGGRWCAALPHSDNYGAFRVIAPPGESQQISGRIATLLRELVDVDTGQPAVTTIWHPATQNRGRMAALLPDLLFGSAAGGSPRGLQSPCLGSMFATTQRIRPGNHRGSGFVVAAGQDIEGLAGNLCALEDFAGMAAVVLSHGAQARPVPPV